MGWARARETATERWVASWTSQCHATTAKGRQCSRRPAFMIAVDGKHNGERACRQHVARMQDRRVAKLMNSRRVTVEEVQR